MLSSIAFTIYRIIWTSVSPYSNLKLHFNYKLISIYLRAHYQCPNVTPGTDLAVHCGGFDSICNTSHLFLQALLVFKAIALQDP